MTHHGDAYTKPGAISRVALWGPMLRIHPATIERTIRIFIRNCDSLSFLVKPSFRKASIRTKELNNIRRKELIAAQIETDLASRRPSSKRLALSLPGKSDEHSSASDDVNCLAMPAFACVASTISVL